MDYKFLIYNIQTYGVNIVSTFQKVLKQLTMVVFTQVQQHLKSEYMR